MDELHHAAKKRKRNAERARVTRACDRCKRRKIKCNGLQPCEFCCRAEASCTFESAYARGKAPVVLPSNGSGIDTCEAGASPPTSEQAVASQTYGVEATSFPANGQEEQPAHPVSLASPSVLASTPKSHKSVQAGLHGEYIGPASGVSFLQRVQKRLGQATSFSHPDSIFTFGDAPFTQVETDQSLCMMIPRESAQQLIDRYFDFAMPTYRFLHRPTIQAWFVEFYDTFGCMRDTQTAPARIALLLMVLAHGWVYMPDGNKPGPADLGHRLYLVAEQQLTKESGPIRLTSVQARLTQCYYLLTQSRVNHCWRTFGTASQLALATGLNRSSRNGMDETELECRRRTFWCAYTLDVHLSVVLGRPQLFHDDDIDIELPTDIEDESIGEAQTCHTAVSTGLSTMLAPLAHINLARIVKRIIRKLYPLKPITATRRTTLTSEISKDLTEWRSNLMSFLDTESFSASLFLPIVQRQRNVLNLTYWHAIILTHRPFLLRNLSESRQARDHADEGIHTEAGQVEHSVQQCLNSAMNTVNIINQMTQRRQMYRAFWIAAYFAFTASIVLYIYVIQKRACAPEIYSQYLKAAIQCQSQISSVAEKGSLLDRYRLLLEELRLEAVRQTGRSRGPAHTNAAIREIGPQPIPAPFDGFAGQSGHVLVEDSTFDGNIDFSTTMRDQSSDFLGWDQFASMVSSGLGNLDAFLNDDPFGQLGGYSHVPQ